jgi:hypothetical protein
MWGMIRMAAWNQECYEWSLNKPDSVPLNLCYLSAFTFEILCGTKWDMRIYIQHKDHISNNKGRYSSERNQQHHRTTSNPADESAKETDWLVWETYHIIWAKLTYPTQHCHNRSLPHTCFSQGGLTYSNSKCHLYVGNHAHASHCSRDMTRNRLTTMMGSGWTELSITSPYTPTNFTTYPTAGTSKKWGYANVTSWGSVQNHVHADQCVSAAWWKCQYSYPYVAAATTWPE